MRSGARGGPTSYLAAALLATASCAVAAAEPLTWQEANRRSAAALEQKDRKEAAAYARQAFDLYEIQSKNYTVANHAQLLMNLVDARIGTVYAKTLLKELELCIGRVRKRAGRADGSIVELWEEGATLAVAAIEMRIAHEHYAAAADEADSLWGVNDPRAIMLHQRWANDLRMSRGYSWAKAKLSEARERAATGERPLLLIAIDLNLVRLETEAERHETAIPLYLSLIERVERLPDAASKETLQGLYAQAEYAYEEVGDEPAARRMRERLLTTFGGTAQQELTAVFRIMPPSPARATGGSVTLRVWVKPDGTVRDVALVSSTDNQYDKPCIEAVRRWKFLPRVVDGQAVEQDGLIKLYFRTRTNHWSG